MDNTRVIQAFNNDKLKQGFDGEEIIRELLKSKNHKYGQIDLVSIDKNNKIYFYEIKHQERFKSPPFDGHGLPPWQFEFRLKIAKLTGMIPFFIVIEPDIDIFNEKVLFYQNMEVLNDLPKDKKFITNGVKKRLIFPIEEFRMIKIKQ